jgi:hypothetical protein
VNVQLLAVERYWGCPNCTEVKVTRRAEPHTPFHPGRGLKGLTAPLVPAGTRCKVEAVERQADIGREKGLRFDGEGRPMMGVRTVRDDGEDFAVFAPTATVNLREHQRP